MDMVVVISINCMQSKCQIGVVFTIKGALGTEGKWCLKERSLLSEQNEPKMSLIGQLWASESMFEVPDQSPRHSGARAQ